MSCNTVHILQPGRLFFNDVKNTLAKLVHQLLRINGTDAFNHAAAQIFLDALFRSRRRAVEHLGPELLAIFLVLHPSPLSRDPFSCTDGC